MSMNISAKYFASQNDQLGKVRNHKISEYSPELTAKSRLQNFYLRHMNCISFVSHIHLFEAKMAMVAKHVILDHDKIKVT